MDGKPVTGSNNETGKSGSQPANGSREPISATLRVPGVVNPALARNTTGTAARAGSGNPTGNAPEPAREPTPEPEPRRGAGRPAGSRNKPKTEGSISEPKAAPVNINGVEKILFSIHEILAAVSNVSELKIDEKEAKELAAAIAGVTNEYIIVLTPKQAALMELGRVCGVIYGPRAVNIWLEAKNKQSIIHPPQPRREPPPDAPPAPRFDPTKITVN
jgi:hypothetical protein